MFGEGWEVRPWESVMILLLFAWEPILWHVVPLVLVARLAGPSLFPQKRLGPQVGATLRLRAPLISSQRPCGVRTALRRMAAQLLHLSTTPIGAA